MYENLYSDNFIINFIPSFIFLVSLTLFSFSKVLEEKNKFNFFDETKPLIIFFSAIYLNVFIFNIIIIFNLYNIFHYIIYFYISSIILISIFLKNKLNFSFLHFEKKNIFIYLTLVIFFLISILPLSDVDSISVHLKSVSHIFINGLKNLDLNQNFEFLSITNQEIILLFSPILKSDNFGSQLNFFSLLIFFLIFKNKISFLKLILSCPIIIFLISTQKLQLFFALLFLLLFYLIKNKKIKSNFEIFIFIFLLSFYASGKIYYIFFSILLMIYFYLLNKKKLNKILFYSLINLLFFLPIFIIKYKYFNNPIAPFFDYLFNDSRIIFEIYSNSLRSSQGWISSLDNYLIYIKPFLPTSIKDLTNNLGLIFLLLLLNYNLQKKLHFIPIIMVFTILSTGQILSRYYYEAFLLLIFFYEKNNLLVKFLSSIQLSFIIIFSLIFLYLSYIDQNVIFNKKKFMNNFSYGYKNINEFEKVTKENNYLLVSQGRSNIFASDKAFPKSYLDIQNIKINDNQLFINFLKNKKIRYIISHNNTFFPKCVLSEKVATVNQLDARRNFFVKKALDTYIFKISMDNCV